MRPPPRRAKAPPPEGRREAAEGCGRCAWSWAIACGCQRGRQSGTREDAVGRAPQGRVVGVVIRICLDGDVVVQIETVKTNRGRGATATIIWRKQNTLTEKFRSL